MKDRPFYKEGLVEVSSPELVRRYNEALTSLGLSPTKLESFHLDGIGWSPEIAQERQVTDYLSHGPASSLAIILGPDQRGKPLYAPQTSFDQDVLQGYFTQFSGEIADITRNACLCLELDHTPPSYSSPKDVLTFQSVMVKSSAGNFGKAVREQGSLVKTFLEDDTAWFGSGLRQQIIASAKQYGDLRERATIPPDFAVDAISSFSMRLFGGVFVLRPQRGNPYLILKDKEVLPERQKNTFHLLDTKLLPKLLRENIIAVDETWYRDQPQLLQNKYDALLADSFFKVEPTLDLVNLPASQRKQRLGHFADQLPPVLFELEQFILKLNSGAKLRSNELSRALILLLLHPHPTMQEQERDILWQLLCHVQRLNAEPLDIVQLYERDIAHFFELYQTWSEARQTWAESYLRARGVV